MVDLKYQGPGGNQRAPGSTAALEDVGEALQVPRFPHC